MDSDPHDDAVAATPSVLTWSVALRHGYELLESHVQTLRIWSLLRALGHLDAASVKALKPLAEHRPVVLEKQSVPSSVKRLMVGVPETRSATAILRVLRKPRDEAQFTQILAAVAASNDEIAGCIARMLVAAAPHAAQREALGYVPSNLRCRPEATLTALSGDRHGRVDLRFDNEAHGFTLFAELKLHSAYGPDQVQRYSNALADLPADRRSALVAVTRNVPGVGEPTVDQPQWLGSLRWTDIYDELAALDIKDRDLRSQWRLLLAIIDEQGDFGVKQLDRQDIVAWAAYVKTREKLEFLIADLAPKALEQLQMLLMGREAWAGSPREQTADLYRRGKDKKVPYPTQKTVQARILIPAGSGERLRIQFLGGLDRPYFTVEARRYGMSALMADEAPGAAKFKAAVNRLTHSERAFDTDGRTYVAHVHPPDRWLDHADGKSIGEALLELITDDVRLLVESGILDPDSGFEADTGHLDAPDEQPVDDV